MKPYLIAIAAMLTVGAAAQTGPQKVYTKTEYINGNFYRQTTETIKLPPEQGDVYFFRQHFSLPYYLPKKFTDQQYKNRTLSVWQNPNGRKDDHQNWEYTYTYDSIGRVTNFAFSSCFVCSTFPYRYTVTYNAAGQISCISNAINIRDSFQFYYDDQGDIVKLEKYLSDKLATVIELQN